MFVTFPVYESGKLLVDSNAYRRKFANNEFIKAKVVHVLKGQDLALVELEKLPAGVSVLRLAGRSARPGEVVHSIGNPGASDAAWLYTKGEVRQVSHKSWQAKGGDGRILSFDAEVLDGGKGLLDQPRRRASSGHSLFSHLAGDKRQGERSPFRENRARQVWAG